MSAETEAPPPPLTGTQWLIVILAAIGFAFDIYELLMLPLIIRPALLEIGGIQFGTAEFDTWRNLLFYVPAACGGIFGLLGGYLTDLFGRRRVLTWSIILYAFSAFAAGFSTSLEMLLVLRCLTFVGFCVEFVAAVAWLSELFTHPKQRESVLGWTQAASSLGGLMVAEVYHLCGKYAESFPAIPLSEAATGLAMNSHAPWRYTLMSGLLPALPLLIIRPFLPESPIWKKKKEAGTLKRPSLMELFAPGLARTTVVSTLMIACSYGAALGAIQFLPQIVPGLPELRVAADAPKEVKDAATKTRETTVARVQTTQELGGLAGRCLLTLLIVRIVSRQAVLRVFLLPGLIVIPLVFIYPATTSLNMLFVGVFFAGLLTVAQLSFWGNYLPRMYPLHLRGTGESFGANIGGRLIGTSFALLTTTVAGAIGPMLPAPPGAAPKGPPAAVASATGEATAAPVATAEPTAPPAPAATSEGTTGQTTLPAVEREGTGAKPAGTGGAAGPKPGAGPPRNPKAYAYAAAAVGGFAYLMAIILSFFLPEPKPEDLHGE